MPTLDDAAAKAAELEALGWGRFMHPGHVQPWNTPHGQPPVIVLVQQAATGGFNGWIDGRDRSKGFHLTMERWVHPGWVAELADQVYARAAGFQHDDDALWRLVVRACGEGGDEARCALQSLARLGGREALVDYFNAQWRARHE